MVSFFVSLGKVHNRTYITMQLRFSDVGVTSGARSYYFIGDFAHLQDALIDFTLKVLKNEVGTFAAFCGNKTVAEFITCLEYGRIEYSCT